MQISIFLERNLISSFVLNYSIDEVLMAPMYNKHWIHGMSLDLFERNTWILPLDLESQIADNGILAHTLFWKL